MIATLLFAAPPRLRSARRVTVVVALLVLALASTASAAPLPVQVSATVEVNVLFVGFEERTYAGHEDEPNDYQAIYGDVIPEFMPRSNDLTIRSEFEGDDAHPVPLGEHLDYRSRVAFAPPAFERRFFDHLERIGRESAPTLSQRVYTDMANNAVDIREPILRISGADVERWLLANARGVTGLAPGADTIVFINWWGKPGFRFHVYDPGAGDPVTGTDGPGTENAGSAWGGSHGRLWFYDMSAGPDRITRNYDVDAADVTGDGYADYRIPPIWELREDLPSWLINDATVVAGMLARYAVYGLFTASPWHDPLTSVPAERAKRMLRIRLLQGDPGTGVSQLLDLDTIKAELQALQPYLRFDRSFTERPVAAADLDALRIFNRAFAGLPAARGCWTSFGSPFEELYCYVTEHAAEFAPPADPGDWVIPAPVFNLTDAGTAEVDLRVVGYADNDPDGKPYAVLVTTFPRHRNGPFGVGATHLVQHETGHHFGLAHTFSGWDAEEGFTFLPFYSPWLHALSECQCPMGVLPRTRFGAFDRDNLDRNLTARLYAESVRRLGSLPPADGALVEAQLRAALAHFAAGDFRQSVRRALAAYYRVGAPRHVRPAVRGTHRNEPLEGVDGLTEVVPRGALRGAIPIPPAARGFAARARGG